jgi:hypothetical protein
MKGIEKKLICASVLVVLMVLPFANNVLAGSVGSGVTGAGTVERPLWSSEPPAPGDARSNLLSRGLDKINLPGPALRITGTPASPDPASETPAEDLTLAPGTLVVKKNSSLASIVPAGYASHVLEPSVANDGKYVFYTANWFAARSTNLGTSWVFTDPFAGFAAPNAFCCDQETIHDPGRRMIIWLRQGSKVAASGENQIKVGVSKDGGATFCTYTWSPTTFNAAWTGQWFDYPHLAVSDNYLWFATNMFSSADAWTRTVMLKLNMDNLAACAGVGYGWYQSQASDGAAARFNFTPVQGATTTMYFGTHNDTSSFRIYKWPESASSPSFVDRSIPAWTSTFKGSATCTTTDGFNPCARTDHRVLSGFRAEWDTLPGEKVLGFSWNVKQDATHAKPYTNVVIFKERDRSYVSNPALWSSDTAYIYANFSPNARGHLGYTATKVSTYPSHIIGIDDDYNVAPAPWSITTVGTGVKGPSDNKWGDYSRTRPLSPAALHWAATGYFLDAASVSQPKFVIFGRERDNNAYSRWSLY